MTSIGLRIEDFPKQPSEIRGQWAVVYLEPIMGSGERFGIGIAVVGNNDFFVLRADMLTRFECLYGMSGRNVVFTAEAALEALSLDIAARGHAALSDPHPAVAGLYIGPVRDGAGSSLAAIAQSWLGQFSSFTANPESAASQSDAEANTQGTDAGNHDRLPMLVAKQVLAERPGLKNYFRTDLLPDSESRKRRKGIGVLIDFNGSRIVANFCTLNQLAGSKTAQEIKPRLWDLKVDRDGAGSFDRTHELLLFRPSEDNPAYTAKRLTHIQETIDELQRQADQEGIGVRPLPSVEAMAAHVLQMEQAVH